MNTGKANHDPTTMLSASAHSGRPIASTIERISVLQALAWSAALYVTEQPTSTLQRKRLKSEPCNLAYTTTE